MASRSSRPNPRLLRARLVIRGYTYKSFAETHGFRPATVKSAVRGVRLGPKSKQVVAAIKNL